jgi:TonB-dependent receptor
MRKTIRAGVNTAVLIQLAFSVPAVAMQDADTAAQDGTDDEQAIVVTGIRASLQNALNKKREANAIVDGISADDLGDIPDQDLGEALQRIPGVQIERGPNSERRSSSVSVRGLPSIFTKTTLLGQNIASAGAARFFVQPFGIYDSSIFSGLSVVKSATADLQSGGIGATVDFDLQSALNRRDGALSVRGEVTYEENPNAFLPGVFITASKHLADGRLGVYANVAFSRLEFRRDIISITAYDTLPEANYPQLDPNSAVANDLKVIFPGTIRQSNEYNRGYRLSASAGMEYEISDTLRFRTDAIYSRRILDDSRLEDLQVDTLGVGEIVSPQGQPVDLGTFDFDFNGTRERVHLFPQVNLANVSVTAAKRIFDFYEKSFAVFPQLNFEDDDWNVDLILGYSDASNEFDQRAFTMGAPSVATPGGNGVTASVNSTLGNVRDFLLDLNIPAERFNFAAQPWSLNANGTTATNAIGNRFTLSSNSQLAQRNLWSAEVNLKRRIDFGPVTAIKGGMRYEYQSLDTLRQNLSLIGTNLNALNNNIFQPNSALTSGNDFFGGIVSGIERDNFLSLDLGLIEGLLLPRVGPCAGSAENVLHPEYCQSAPLPNFPTLNFTAERKLMEAHFMAEFDFNDLLGLNVRGNAGMRYSSYDIAGRLDSGGAEQKTGSQQWLPSANLIWDITDRLVFNAAYYQTYEAYDLARFSPAGTIIINTPTVINVDLTQFDLEPRVADSYDVGLSWYNRAGSILAVNLFHKSLTSEQVRTVICPPTGVAGFAPLFLASNGNCFVGGPTGTPILAVQLTSIDEKTTINGVEFQAQQDLGFLDGFLSGFGLSANYTILDINTPPGATLFAVSEKTLNLIGYYEREFGSIRLAYNHRSPEVLVASPNPIFGPTRTNAARGQFDLALRVTPVKDLDLRLEVFNLTNARRYEYQDDPRLFRRADYDGRVIKFSVQKSF